MPDLKIQHEYKELAEEYAGLVKAHFNGRLRSICFFGSAALGNRFLEAEWHAHQSSSCLQTTKFIQCIPLKLS